jgi:hypothetical protein
LRAIRRSGSKVLTNPGELGSELLELLVERGSLLLGHAEMLAAAVPTLPGVPRRHLEILAIALVVAAAATQIPYPGWNAGAHYALVRSLVDGTPRIDHHLNQSGDIAYVDGHYYAAKSPGLAFLSVPVYLVFDAVGAVPATYVTGQGPPGARQVAERAIWQVNLLVIAAFAALLLLIRWTVDGFYPGAGTVAALVLGLGTMLLPFATAYFSHVVSATLGFAAFAVLVAERGRGSRPLLVAAGALAGLSVFTELPTAIVGGCLAGYAIADSPRLRRGLEYGSGFVAGVLPLAAYNWWALGSPFRSGYNDAVKVLGTSGHDVLGANGQGFFGLTRPKLHAAYDLLFSNIGLFVLTPVTLVAVLGLVLLNRGGHRREARLVSAIVLAFLVYNAAYYLPFGGATPGPRFLVPLLPFLALPLAAVYRRWWFVALAAGAVSAFWMVAATIAGPLLPPETSPTVWLSELSHGREVMGSMLGKGTAGAVAFLVPAVLAVVAGAWAVLGPSEPAPR